jgi:hypothetical protein
MNTLEARIRAAVRATAEEIARGSIPPLDLADRGRRRYRGPVGPVRSGGRWPRVLIPLAAAASVIAVVAISLAVTSGPYDRAPAGSSPAASAGARSAAFRHVGTGPQTDSLDCVTARVCYAWDSAAEGHGAERTSDGGATWRPVAALPDRRSLAGQNADPSCPTAEMCVGGAGGLALAVTTDGGGHWSIQSLPRPPGTSGASIDQVSCATAEKCVVHIRDNGSGTFLSTSNGGKTWTAAAAIPPGAPRYLWLLRCDPDGRCIGVYPTGTNTNGGLLAMRSADNGRTWAISSAHAPATDTFMVSCGDALHCMSVGDNGATMTTSDGGVTWRERTAPSTWPSTATSVSCPAAGDCFIALADANTSGYSRPVIEATHDGGSIWSPLPLPTVGGSPLALVYPLSCPSPAGCIAMAATRQEYEGAGAPGRRVIISSLPTS